LIDTKAIRTKVLDLAIQGKLTEQKAEDGTGEELYQHILARIAETAERRNKKHPKTIASSNQETFVIPPNWIWVRLGDVCTNIEYGSSNKSSATGKMPVLRMGNIQNGRISYSDLVFTSDEEEIAKYSLKEGDLLFNRCNSIEHVGKTGIYRNEMPAIFAGYLVRIRPVLMSADYLNFVMQSSYYWKYCASVRSDAVGQSNINAEKIKQFRFPLPPLAEQQRIVELMSNVISALDGIDDQQKKYTEDIEMLRVKLFEAALRGKLTEQLTEDGTAEELYQQIQAEKQGLVKAKKIKKEQPLPPIETKDIPFPIPTNWKWVRLGDIARKIASGNTPTGGRNSDVYVQSGYCLFREQNIYNDGIHEEGMVYITEELLATRENSTVYAGDILLNITGGSIGRCAVVPDSFDRGSVNQHILIIRMIDERLRHYIHKVICSQYAQKYINQKAFGDKGGFSGTRCKMMPIPLPPLEEQKRIVERIDSIYASI